MISNASTLRVNDLDELDALGLLDAAIEDASARRQSSMEVGATEAESIHGGVAYSGLRLLDPNVCGYFPVEISVSKTLGMG